MGSSTQAHDTRIAVFASPLWLLALGVAWVVHSRRLARQQELQS